MAYRMHGPRYCEVCNGYSISEVNLNLHSDNSNMIANPERELRRLYNIETTNNHLLARNAQLEEIVEQQRLQIQDHQNRELNGSVESMTRQWFDLEKKYEHLLEDYAVLKECMDRTGRQRREEKWIEENRRQQLLKQIENLEERLMAGESWNARMHVTDGSLPRVVDFNTQREGREWPADRPTMEDLWMAEANIVILSKQIAEQSDKIRHLEAIIDMQNRRLQEKDNTFHRLMVKHKTLMKED